MSKTRAIVCLIYVMIMLCAILASLSKGHIQDAGNILVGAVIFSPIVFIPWGGGK